MTQTDFPTIMYHTYVLICLLQETREGCRAYGLDEGVELNPIYRPVDRYGAPMIAILVLLERYHRPARPRLKPERLHPRPKRMVDALAAGLAATTGNNQEITPRGLRGMNKNVTSPQLRLFLMCPRDRDLRNSFAHCGVGLVMEERIRSPSFSRSTSGDQIPVDQTRHEVKVDFLRENTICWNML